LALSKSLPKISFKTLCLMSDDEEKALIPLMRKAIDANEKIKHKVLKDILGKDFDNAKDFDV
jgi:hypothetical protein